MEIVIAALLIAVLLTGIIAVKRYMYASIHRMERREKGGEQA